MAFSFQYVKKIANSWLRDPYPPARLISAGMNDLIPVCLNAGPDVSRALSKRSPHGIPSSPATAGTMIPSGAKRNVAKGQGG